MRLRVIVYNQSGCFGNERGLPVKVVDLATQQLEVAVMVAEAVADVLRALSLSNMNMVVVVDEAYSGMVHHEIKV